jgi:hypothetical protein
MFLIISMLLNLVFYLTILFVECMYPSYSTEVYTIVCRYFWKNSTKYLCVVQVFFVYKSKYYFPSDRVSFKHRHRIVGTCKVRNEIEAKRNETERNETKSSETKRNRWKRNETKRNDVTFRFVSFWSVSFRSVSFRFVRFRFVSFRTLQVPSFDSGFSKNEILELFVFN